MIGCSYFTVEKIIRDKLISIFEPTILEIKKQNILVKISFMTAHAKKLIKFDVHKLVSKFYPWIDFNMILTNEFSIGNLLHFKDKISP